MKSVDADITEYSQLWREIQESQQSLAKASKNAKLNVMLVRDALLLSIITLGRRDTNVKLTKMVMEML